MNIKRFLPFAVLLGCLSFVPVVWAGELPYNQYDQNGDLSSDAQDFYESHFEAAYWMKEWGIFDGYQDGTFGALNEINRAELAKVLVLSTGVTEDYVKEYVASYDAVNGTSDYFLDLDISAWYVPYIRYAQIQGWVSGYDDGSYRPANSVLICEALKMVLESQYGTPGNEYAGDNWYDLYLNVFLDFNIVEYSGYYGYEYTYLPVDDSIGYFMGSLTSLGDEARRKDIAELLYRVRILLEDGDGEFVVYNPILTIDQYEEMYGATVEVNDNMISVSDPYFGFDIHNIYIGDLELDDVEVLITDPSGFENGWISSWRLLYPIDGEFFIVYIQEQDGASYSYAKCLRNGWGDDPAEYFDIAYALCGVVYDYDGLIVSLDDIGDIESSEPMAIVDFSKVMDYGIVLASDSFESLDFISQEYVDSDEYAILLFDDYYDRAVEVFDFLVEIGDLESENASQTDDMRNLLAQYIDISQEYLVFFGDVKASGLYDSSESFSYENILSDYYDQMQILIDDYEKDSFTFDNDFVVDVQLHYSNPKNDLYHPLSMYSSTSVVVSGDVEEDFVSVDGLDVLNDSEFDIWDGVAEGIDDGWAIDDKWIRVTLSGTALDYDDLYSGDEPLYGSISFASMDLVDGASSCYWYEILDMEWVEK